MSPEVSLDTLKVAVCQMTSIDDPEYNLIQMAELLDRIPKTSQARIAFFPENCLYMRIKEGEKIAGFKLSDPIFKKVEDLAQANRVALHLGSVPLVIDDKLFNCSVFIGEDGKARPTYRKNHLFDIELLGQTPIRESDVFSRGDGPSSLAVYGWSFGQTICYDLRFSELYSKYALEGVDVLLVPAAFLVKTGQAHWEVLLRARAIESQCYVIAAAQAGSHFGVNGGQRETYGHSVIIDPWGKIEWIGSSGSPEVGVFDLVKSKIDQVRLQIPMKNHRRV